MSFLIRATSGTMEQFLRFVTTSLPSNGSSGHLEVKHTGLKCGKTPGKREVDAWTSSEREISCTFRCQPKQAHRFVSRHYWGNIISSSRTHLSHISVCIHMNDMLRNAEWMNSLFLIFSRHGRIQGTGMETRAAAAITIPSISVTLGIRYRPGSEIYSTLGTDFILQKLYTKNNYKLYIYILFMILYY